MRRKQKWLFSVIFLLILALVACGGDDTVDTPAEAEDPAVPEADTGADADVVPEEDEGPVEEAVEVEGAPLTLWSHSAGNPNEIAVVEQMIADYNAMQDQYTVILESFPQASYNDSVAAASIAGSLPCIVDLDAPTVPNFAWSGFIQPLPVPEEEIEALNILDADIGRYDGDIYSLGQFDVALLIYARQSVLEENDIRIPTIEEPWTLDEFMSILDTFDQSGEWEYAFDPNVAGTGEWVPYAYSPWLQSFGGDLINRDNYQEAEGVLNGPEAVAWGEWFQSLFEEGYANPTPADDQSFNQGEVPLWYTGSWAAQSVLEAWGDDALFLPPPDFGEGAKIGAGSWQFGVSSTCEDPEGAAEFIMFTMEPENVALMSESSSLIPTTPEGAAMTELYQEGGDFRIFYDLAEAFAVKRPATPGYNTISSQFEQAALSIRDGGSVQDALDDAVDAIERDIEDNNGYGFTE